MKRRVYDSELWCDASFGPPFTVPSGESYPHKYRCRLMKGHDGRHDCRAAEGDGYVEPAHAQITRVRSKSAAARKVFG